MTNLEALEAAALADTLTEHTARAHGLVCIWDGEFEYYRAADFDAGRFEPLARSIAADLADGSNVELSGMTNLERMIAAEGVQGGTIADYDRRFLAHELSGKSLSQMDHSSGELGAHARRLMDAGHFELARTVSRATIAHLEFARA